MYPETTRALIAGSFVLGGVALGWILNGRSSKRQRALDVRLRLHETKVEAYAIWMQAVTTNFYAYVMGDKEDNDATHRHAAMLAYRKLLLLEEDDELRRILEEVYDLYPKDEPQVAKIQNALISSTIYAPFDSKLKRIAEKVRSLRPTK